MNLGADSYDIVVARGALDRVGKLFDLDRRVMIVTDSGVPSRYTDIVKNASKEPFLFCSEEGEEAKSIRTWEQILTAMMNAGFTRKDCVVAVGGGMVGDMAGFAAASYMRGIDFYNIPTTVLSQVDSSIGGKTAVNLGGIKNIVGAFHQPKKVIVDLDTLDTLGDRLVSEGLAEALKMGLTSDKALFELFEKGNIKDSMDEIILRSLAIKKNVVEQDEKENGLRKILNFGHTIGHGVEAACGLYHGECVAVGMIPMVSEALKPRLIAILERLSLPTSVTQNPQKIYEAMLHDKKSEGDGVTVVTVPAPGQYEMNKISFKELYPLIETITR
jgi:3-dehydroquinate synthase